MALAVDSKQPTSQFEFETPAMLSADLRQFLFLSSSSAEHNRVGALAWQQEDGCLSWPGQSEHSSLPSMFCSHLLRNAELELANTGGHLDIRTV